MRIMSTLAFRGALDEMAPVFSSEFRQKLEFLFDPTAVMLGRIRSGERADVALLTAAGIDDLRAAKILAAGSRVDIAVSEVGLAVRAGAPKPDISTPDAVRKTLLAANSIVYSRAGASGIFFAGLLQRLGIADEVNAKATVIASGFTAELAADGRAEIAVQQVSELMAVAGVDIVGALPEGAQERLTFSGGIFAETAVAAEARRFLQFLARPEFAAVYRRKGLLPVAG